MFLSMSFFGENQKFIFDLNIYIFRDNDNFKRQFNSHLDIIDD